MVGGGGLPPRSGIEKYLVIGGNGLVGGGGGGIWKLGNGTNGV